MRLIIGDVDFATHKLSCQTIDYVEKTNIKVLHACMAAKLSFNLLETKHSKNEIEILQIVKALLSNV